jgi:peptidyl-prolyl cis-trans isomerase C
MGPVLILAAAILAAGVVHGAPARKARAKSGAPDSNQVLVKIGKGGITRADVDRRIRLLPEQFRANYSTPEGRQQLLERMVEERVWYDMAVRAGYPNRAEVKAQLEQTQRDLLIRSYMNELMATNPAVSDSEARAFYDANQAEYKVPATVSLRHIQVKSESEAKRLLRSAPKQDWAKLVERYSGDSLTRANGGSLGTVTREGTFATLGPQPALAESAFALGEGKIGGPYRTDRGWHVVRVDAIRPESVRPFDQVRQAITRQLGSQRSQSFYQEKLDAARKSLGVAPDSAAIKGFVSQKKSARDMFNDAQAAGAAQQRIDAYRRLLTEYPDSDVSPQAQFMIGFVQSEELKDYDAAEQSFRELLARYPKAELAASAQWMIDHMREEDAPAFIELEADSVGRAPGGAPHDSSNP